MKDPAQWNVNSSDHSNLLDSEFWGLDKDLFQKILTSSDIHSEQDGNFAKGKANASLVLSKLLLKDNDTKATAAIKEIVDKLDIMDGQQDGMIKLEYTSDGNSILQYGDQDKLWQALKSEYINDNPLEILNPKRNIKIEEQVQKELAAGAEPQNSMLLNLEQDAIDFTNNINNYTSQKDLFNVQDFNNDGKIDKQDFKIMLQNWETKNNTPYYSYVSFDEKGMPLPIIYGPSEASNEHIYTTGKVIAADIISKQKISNKAMFVGFGDAHWHNEGRGYGEAKACLKAAGKKVYSFIELPSETPLHKDVINNPELFKENSVYHSSRISRSGMEIALIQNVQLGIPFYLIDDHKILNYNEHNTNNYTPVASLTNRDFELFKKFQKIIKYYGIDLNDPDVIILYEGGAAHCSKVPGENYFNTDIITPTGIDYVGYDTKNPLFKRITDEYGADSTYSVGMLCDITTSDNPNINLQYPANSFDMIVPAEKPISDPTVR